MIPVTLWHRPKLSPVPSRGFVLVYMIPSKMTCVRLVARKENTRQDSSSHARCMFCTLCPFFYNKYRVRKAKTSNDVSVSW